jgi:CrcB protein
VLNILLIALGGALGALSRYGVGLWLKPAGDASAAAAFPFATLAVNVAGCLLIGVILGWFGSKYPTETAAPDSTGLIVRMTVVGFLGGLTTFSSFGWETFELLRRGDLLLGFGNMAANLILGLAAVALGWFLAAKL